jgi:hypothetical protein
MPAFGMESLSVGAAALRAPVARIPEAGPRPWVRVAGRAGTREQLRTFRSNQIEVILLRDPDLREQFHKHVVLLFPRLIQDREVVCPLLLLLAPPGDEVLEIRIHRRVAVRVTCVGH